MSCKSACSVRRTGENRTEDNRWRDRLAQVEAPADYPFFELNLDRCPSVCQCNLIPANAAVSSAVELLD